LVLEKFDADHAQQVPKPPAPKPGVPPAICRRFPIRRRRRSKIPAMRRFRPSPILM
jgi:hypothetical protein